MKLSFSINYLKFSYLISKSKHLLLQILQHTKMEKQIQKQIQIQKQKSSQKQNQKHQTQHQHDQKFQSLKQQLNYILLNLSEPPYSPSISQAFKNRKNSSNHQIPFTLTDIKQYYVYGPGVTLYFSLLRFLIICFVAMSIISIPMMISNLKGNGLKMYHEGQYKYDIMKFSLANQQFFQFPSQEWTESDNDRLQGVRDRQVQIIVNDVIISIMFGFLLLYWNSHAKDIVKSLIQKQDKTLPSYYTLKLNNLKYLLKFVVGEQEKKQKSVTDNNDYNSDNKNQPSPNIKMNIAQNWNKKDRNNDSELSQIKSIDQAYKQKVLTFLKRIVKIYEDKVNVELSENYQIIQNNAIKINFSELKVQLVHDFGIFLQKIKQFTELVEEQNQESSKILHSRSNQQIFYNSKKQNLRETIQNQYKQIKQIYISKTKKIQSLQKNRQNSLKYGKSQPFQPIKAFITCSTIQQKNLINQSYILFLKSQIQEAHNRQPSRKKPTQKQIKATLPIVQICDVEPANILWQNYHLEDKFDLQQKIKICCVLAFVLFLALLLIFFINISMASLISDPLQFSSYKDKLEYQQNPNPSYHDAVTSNNSILIYVFCSQLTSTTFQWQYYELCSDYFTNFRQNVGKMIILSCVVFCINFFLNKIIHWLAQKRKHRTVSQKQRFLIFNMFVVTLINCGLLVLFIRAQFADVQKSYDKPTANSISLLAFFRLIFPHFFINKRIQLYEQFNRKWYIHIGKQLLFNYTISLILAPWFILFYKIAKTYIKELKARNFRQLTQKKMNKLIQFSQFQLQSFYAITLVSVFFCLCYSSAMPVFYIMAILSLTSIFFSSKIIFKYYCKKPIHLFDHLLNSRISRWLLVSLLIHQIFSIWFIFNQDVFPQKTIVNQESNTQSIQHDRNYVFQIFIYLVLIMLTTLAFIFYQRISQALNESQKQLESGVDSNNIEQFMTKSSNSQHGLSQMDQQGNKESQNRLNIEQNRKNEKYEQNQIKKRRRITSKNKQKQKHSSQQKEIQLNNFSKSMKQVNKEKSVKQTAQQQKYHKSEQNLDQNRKRKQKIKRQEIQQSIYKFPNKQNNSYLRSYKMEDNKQYHSITYTLMILNKIINQYSHLQNLRIQQEKNVSEKQY